MSEQRDDSIDEIMARYFATEAARRDEGRRNVSEAELNYLRMQRDRAMQESVAARESAGRATTAVWLMAATMSALVLMVFWYFRSQPDPVTQTATTETVAVKRTVVERPVVHMVPVHMPPVATANRVVAAPAPPQPVASATLPDPASRASAPIPVAPVSPQKPLGGYVETATGLPNTAGNPEGSPLPGFVER
ncbi:MAG: hypothetical protein OHK0029_06680 [Armatimonadaceae bacterium]